MAEETYKLIYFDLKARAEPARAMFFMTGQKFEDVRILFQDWGKLKTRMYVCCYYSSWSVLVVYSQF